MAGSPESGSDPLEIYKKFNEITLVGSLAFAGVAAFVAPELVVPALFLAGVDVIQIAAINAWQEGNKGTAAA